MTLAKDVYVAFRIVGRGAELSATYVYQSKLDEEWKYNAI